MEKNAKSSASNTAEKSKPHDVNSFEKTLKKATNVALETYEEALKELEKY